MSTNHTAADALAYIRELLGNHLNWIDEALAEEYGRETIDGEEYLPEVLSNVMACLYSVHRDVTEEVVAVGTYMRDDQEQLYRPRAYSTGQPLYTSELTGPEGETFAVTRLQHPSGHDLHTFPADDPSTQRAGLRGMDGGGNCA